jgi:hypothetical protein
MDSDISTDSERRSLSSSSSSDDDFEEFVEDFNEFGIRPYQFEPKRELSNDEDSEEEDETVTESDEETPDSRLTSSEWYVLAFMNVIFLIKFTLLRTIDSER